MWLCVCVCVLELLALPWKALLWNNSFLKALLVTLKPNTFLYLSCDSTIPDSIRMQTEAWGGGEPKHFNTLETQIKD